MKIYIEYGLFVMDTLISISFTTARVAHGCTLEPIGEHQITTKLFFIYPSSPSPCMQDERYLECLRWIGVRPSGTLEISSRVFVSMFMDI